MATGARFRGTQPLVVWRRSSHFTIRPHYTDLCSSIGYLYRGRPVGAFSSSMGGYTMKSAIFGAYLPNTTITIMRTHWTSTFLPK